MSTPEILARKRRVSLSVEEIALLAACIGAMTVKPAVDLRAKLVEIFNEEHDPEHIRLVEAYRAGVNVKDGEAELDDDAEVSIGDDDGAYVMVWTWVSNSDAGLPSIHDDDDEDEDLCRTCGEHYEDGGDGFDGECPSCADKTCAAEEGEDAL